jgi:hypothetical protein
MFRIDPIDKYGNVDVEFFACDEYVSESQILRNYLRLEGFDEMEKVFFIDFRNRKWQVNACNKKQKKK